MAQSKNGRQKFSGVGTDPDTGEIAQINCYMPRERLSMPDFLILFSEGMKILARDKDLTGECLRVLLEILSCSQFRNEVRVTQVQIADLLNMRQQSVHKCFKILTKKNLLLESGRYGNSKLYELNADFFWKGNSKDYKQFLSEQTERLPSSYRYNKNVSKSDESAAA